jgi:putative ABC transport system permease protein
MSFVASFWWHDRARFIPALLALAVSAALVALQFGLLLGTLSFTSTAIDQAPADLWVAAPDVQSIDLGFPISEGWVSRVGGRPEIERVEAYLYGFAQWKKPTGGSVVCCIVGARLGHGSLGAVAGLTPEIQERLAQPGAIAIDRSEFSRLGIANMGDTAEISDRSVRITATVSGTQSIGAPFIFCSLRTARELLPMFITRPNQVTFLLLKCRQPAFAPQTAASLRAEFPDMAVFTRREFSTRTRMHWLTRSKAGIAMGLTSGLSLLVGLIVTSQTLYGATASMLRELAVLYAMGIPRWRVRGLVLSLAFWVGIAGLLAAAPAVLGLARAAGVVGARVYLPGWLLAASAVSTMVTALVSGVYSLRSLRGVEPITLLR